MIFWLTASNVQAKAESFNCVGFSFIISIQECTPKGGGPKAVVSNFCSKLAGKIERLKFTREQTQVFTREQKEILASLMVDYKRSCKDRPEKND